MAKDSAESGRFFAGYLAGIQSVLLPWQLSGVPGEVANHSRAGLCHSHGGGLWFQRGFNSQRRLQRGDRRAFYGAGVIRPNLLFD